MLPIPRHQQFDHAYNAATLKFFKRYEMTNISLSVHKPRSVWLEEVMSEVIVISSTQFMVSLQPKLLPNDSARLSRCFFVCHVQPANCRAAKPAGEFVSTARGRKYFQKISKKKKCTKYHESRSSSKWTGKRNSMS